MKNKLSLFAVPYVGWMSIFVVAPIVIIVVYAFSSADGGFSLENFVNMGEYTDVFLRSFKLALIATAVCLLIGYPVSYWMSREGKSFQRMAMVLPVSAARSPAVICRWQWPFPHGGRRRKRYRLLRYRRP